MTCHMTRYFNPRTETDRPWLRYDFHPDTADARDGGGAHPRGAPRPRLDARGARTPDGGQLAHRPALAEGKPAAAADARAPGRRPRRAARLLRRAGGLACHAHRASRANRRACRTR